MPIIILNQILYGEIESFQLTFFLYKLVSTTLF